MQDVVHRFLLMFLYIVGFTSLITLAGVIYSWYAPSEKELPYLQWLLTISIAEILSVALIFVKTGIKYLPKVSRNKNQGETERFMIDFVDGSSSVTIVSNRVGWLSGSPKFLDFLKEKIEGGANVEIITSQKIENEIFRILSQIGVSLFVTNDDHPPEARFTLINTHRRGAERLAIARGSHPNHEITIFDNDSGPQMIGMAKDIIRKSKRKQNAAPME